jgi:hypothetical protein
MEPFMFVMAILGCGESDAVCQEVRVAQVRYQNQAECLAATGTELLRHEDLPYPTIVAQCRRADAATQTLRGSEVMQPEGGTLPTPPPRFADARRPAERR